MKLKLAVLGLLASLVLAASAFPLIGRTQGGASRLTSPLPTPFVAAPYLATKATSIAASYVVEHYGLSLSAIYIGYEEPVSFPMIQREAIIVSVFKIGEALPDPYRIFIDAHTGEVIENPDSLYEAERKAYETKYGKVDPALYDHLEASDKDVPIPVAIWLATPDLSQIEADLSAEVSTLHPEITQERAIGDKPNAEIDEWASQWRSAYLERLTGYMEGVTTPVLLSLVAEGIEAKPIAGMPLLAATLTKEQIYRVAERTDIETIYPDDTEAEPALDISIPSERVRQVWNRRIGSLTPLSGAGVAIAILEAFNLSGPVVNCLNLGATHIAPTPVPPPAPTPARDPNHKNRVAAAAACDDTTLRGPGFGATVVDVAHGSGEPSAIEALEWVVATPGARRADIINQSEEYRLADGTYDRAIHLLDRAYDYWVFQSRATATVAAGNQGAVSTFVTTPGKAYNVITVGNIDDGDTANWSNDSLYATSSWLNPANNLEKPEVVAYGTGINTVAGERIGTSYAAPQVAGIAALLMERDATLKMWPSAVKAILMASTVNNVIDGNIPSPTGEDRDGAGTVNAALADTIAQNHAAANVTHCDRPCYWTVETFQLPVNQHIYLNYEIDALQGERVRVAIAWLAHAGAPDSYSFSILQSNYDLYIKYPAPNDADVVVASTSQIDNFDIQEFTAPYSGRYRITVDRTPRANGISDADTHNYLAVAWNKQAAYAPDISDDGTWTSSVYLKNDQPTSRLTYIAYRDDGGSSTNYPLVLQPGESVERSPFGIMQGAAVFNGHEDLISLYGMRADLGGLATLDNVFRPPGYGDPAFEQAAATLYMPALYRNAYGATSVIDIQNVGSASTTPRITFFGRTCYSDWDPVFSPIPPGGHLRIDLSPFTTQLQRSSTDPSCVPGWIGSARIDTNPSQPLAVRVLTRDANGYFARSYNAAAQGHYLTYTPVAYKAYGGFTTSLVIQNPGAVAASATVYFFERNGGGGTPAYTWPASSIGSIAPQRAIALSLASPPLGAPPIPDNWAGSINVVGTVSGDTGNAPLVVDVLNTKTINNVIVGVYESAAASAPSGGRLVVLPYVARRYNGRNTTWMVRNISGANITVTQRYYNSNGTEIVPPVTPTPIPLQSAQSTGYPQIGESFLVDNWQGSLVLESTGAIVAVVIEDGPNTIAGYNGVVLSQ